MDGRARYLVRRREFIKHSRRAFGGRVASYGPWKTLAAYDSLEPAAERRRHSSLIGLAQTVVVYRGKVVVDPHGRHT